jgi:uncharacterized membrane protein YqjE
MSESASSASGGLLAATRNSAATLLATGRTRLELLANEISEEKLRAVHLLLLSQVAAFCLMVATILAIGVLLVLFWDNRLAILGGLTAFFLAGSGLAYLALRRYDDAQQPPVCSQHFRAWQRPSSVAGRGRQ